jgi:diguanylate cyclase (GGDEF)-like protein
VFVDVDGLKIINDTHGHAAGDDALREVAQQIRVAMRPYDLCVRYGGDEFLCVFLNAVPVHVQSRFDSVNQNLAETQVPCSISAGVAELDEADSVDDVIARADAQMYRGRERRKVPRG